MKRQTDERIKAAMRLASTLNAKLSESGQPRGERRMYALRMADGSVLETADLGRIERKLKKMTPNVANNRP